MAARSRLGAIALLALAQLSVGAVRPELRLSRRAWSASLGACYFASASPVAARERAQNAKSFGIVTWGGSERCDPTDAACRQGGRVAEAGEIALRVPEPRATVTDRAMLDLSLDRKPAGTFALGLYGAECPRSVETFLSLCRGDLATRVGEAPAGYAGSSIVRIDRGKSAVGGGLTQAGGMAELVLGETKPRFQPVVPAPNDEPGVGGHDAPGLLSMRRGGGAVEYMLTLGPGPSRDLDREWIVIGQVLDSASLELLARLNLLPVNRYGANPLVKTSITACRVQPGS